ncbi:NLI interacting factor-like phosphatase [Micractinium conductrix]|uniref:NLI interacting factor-like phosphatase n=1 Tax=Micractinium conductrix TaxID=554055 RepID=A0A2P6VLR1_9CHLO|nr:NLI interacting factor-like phosphatase [Micractinium conductrix]|eukprot:PSC74997.1 NLI interacting factor-like phosphatase [Micractinium conductrix]
MRPRALARPAASLGQPDSPAGPHHAAAGCGQRGAALQSPAALASTAAAERGVASSLLTGGSSPSSSSGSGGVSLGSSSGRERQLRVAVDVDEVLGRFLHSLNKFCLEAYDMRYDVSDYWVYDFAKIWECCQDESNEKVHAFFDSHHFAAGIETIPGAYDSLLRLRPACEFMVVTSRQHVIQEPTLEWLEEHFPEVFSEVHFGNHFALEGASRKKSEICHAIGAEVLIDDNPAYAKECAEAGIHVLLYDWQHGYPWSKTPDGPRHDRITRVRDWAEVEQVLGVLAAQRSMT